MSKFTRAFLLHNINLVKQYVDNTFASTLHQVFDWAANASTAPVLLAPNICQARTLRVLDVWRCWV